MNTLSCLARALMLALCGFLVPVWQEAFDTVCKVILESLTLKFKYLNAVFVEKPETH